MLLALAVSSSQGFDVFRGNLKTTLLRGGKSDRKLQAKKATPKPAEQVTEWPECIVGYTSCLACQAAIQTSSPSLEVDITYDLFVTMDFRSDRVRVFCARDTNAVSQSPYIG